VLADLGADQGAVAQRAGNCGVGDTRDLCNILDGDIMRHDQPCEVPRELMNERLWSYAHVNSIEGSNPIVKSLRVNYLSKMIRIDLRESWFHRKVFIKRNGRFIRNCLLLYYLFSRILSNPDCEDLIRPANRHAPHFEKMTYTAVAIPMSNGIVQAGWDAACSYSIFPEERY
jgi:hypothetical protein